MLQSTERSTETTGLLGDTHAKQESYYKKGWWLVFAVVCGLVIIFGGFMTKWHLISQSVIEPSAARENVATSPDGTIDEYLPPGGGPAESPQDELKLEEEDKIDVHGPPGPPAAEKTAIPRGDHDNNDDAEDNDKKIDEYLPPGGGPADYPDDNDKDDGELHDDAPPRGGATAPQLGKAFPLTILAQIAWKDISSIVSTTFGIDNKNDNGGSLAQSGSMMPVYVNEQDCLDAIDYFEKSVVYGKTGYEKTYGKAGGERDCQYVDLTHFVMDNNNDNNNNDIENECDTELGLLGEETSLNRMFEITNRMIEYFSDNYGNYLVDCDVPDVRMIKYISNGTRYSGLHAETHHIDGRKFFINEKERQVDYVGVVFLNDNFDGGDLQFVAPKAINSITPQTGNGVLFGGGLDYAHRVTPVTNGDRYVLRMIFNKKQE